MDIISTQDQAVSTDLPAKHKPKDEKNIEHLERSTSTTRGEKKKSGGKKLKKKLIQIEEQNESLSKMINEKNSEIEELRKSVNSLNDVLNSVPIDELRCNSSIASNRLLELSKKNRQLRAELETTKNRLSRKEWQVQKLEKDLKVAEEKHNQDVDSNMKNSSPGNELQSKLVAMQQKLFETRNKNIELTNQLKLAQKCLQQETGENFNLNLLASHSTTSQWRGRAQQIINLQQKVQELKERLESYEQQQANGYFVNSPDITGMVPNDVFLKSGESMPSIYRPNVRRSELEHRNRVEGLEKEIAALQTQLEEGQNKILALKVRNKTLNDEISRYKLKANNLEQQSDYNNINVATMSDNMNQLKLEYEQRLADMASEMKDLTKKNEELAHLEGNLRDTLDEREASLASKDEEISELKTVIKKLEDDMKALCGDFLFSCREFRKEEFVTILDSLESEKNSLMEHIKTLNERIDKERIKTENLLEQVGKQRIRISRLEAKVREMEREIEMSNEKKKRSQRIAEYASSLSAVGSSTSLKSFIFENTSMTKASSAAIHLPNDDNTNVVELRNRLELDTEKITILQEKLEYLTMEKENDLKAFEEIVNNTKNVILETIMAQRNSFTSM
uniref:Coiled-coil domain-containing protein 13 n=1 Tax=Stomoxys calcitrans TaxID=35570 RepID=A0A1I8Q6C2_STOCA